MTVKLYGNYDVIVCGGGTAGTLAAISAARNGAKTLLIERNPFLGGMAVMGFWPHVFYTRTGKKAVAGLPQEIIDRLVSVKGSLGHLRYEGGHLYSVTPVDYEVLKVILEQMVIEAQVDVMLNATICDISMEEKRISGIVVQTKTDTIIANSKIVIDCTGDGDVAAMAGAPFNKGREDGKMQPASLVMRLTNVDLIKMAEEVPTYAPVLFAEKPGSDVKTPVYFQGRLGPWDNTEEAQELFTDKDHQIFCLSPWVSDVIVNTSRIVGVDGICYEQVNDAQLKSRQQIYAIYQFIRKYLPGFSKANFIGGYTLGVRETRRFIGDYELTENDVLSGRKFMDNIGLGAYPLDMHDPDGGNVTFTQIGDDGCYGIPYRSLIPRVVENVLVAGRCISATHLALASVRSIGACMVMGQAVGLAASIAAKSDRSIREMDVSHLQDCLESQGVILY